MKLVVCMLCFVTGFACAGAFLGGFFYYYDDNHVPYILKEEYIDAIQIAQQLGRLDILSLILTLFAILLGFLGLAWLSNIHNNAQLIAQQIATEVADKVARQTASEYFNKEEKRNETKTSFHIDPSSVNIDSAKKENNNE